MRRALHGDPNVQSSSAFKTFDTQERESVGYMFPALAADPSAKLPVGPRTIEGLKKLGDAMAADTSAAESRIPAVYTYFGQFIDHDITKTTFRPPLIPDPISGDFSPMDPATVGQAIMNERSMTFDLDSVYGAMAQEAINPDGTMRLSEVSVAPFGRIPTTDRFHDAPRRPMIENPAPAQQEADRQAIIGDPRNDENLIVAQLHVAFLRAHNALMARSPNFQDARRALRRRYQWSVLHDFLPRVCDPGVVADVVANGPKFWAPVRGAQTMPLEFSTAAYRFGHSMIRGFYNHNATFDNAPFALFFTFTALSGDLAPSPGPSTQFRTLPDNWITDWSRFFGSAASPASLNPARRIDAHLTPELGNLRTFQGIPIADLMSKLATRNLLRGHLFNLPTGQAVARHMGLAPLEASSLLEAVAPQFRPILKDHGFDTHTPLWFYVLAEAGNEKGPNGNHLGPVGSRIVVETIWNAVKESPDSVLVDAPTSEELASGEFTLKGIVRMGLDASLPPLAN